MTIPSSGPTSPTSPASGSDAEGPGETRRSSNLMANINAPASAGIGKQLSATTVAARAQLKSSSKMESNARNSNFNRQAQRGVNAFGGADSVLFTYHLMIRFRRLFAEDYQHALKRRVPGGNLGGFGKIGGIGAGLGFATGLTPMLPGAQVITGPNGEILQGPPSPNGAGGPRGSISGMSGTGAPGGINSSFGGGAKRGSITGSIGPGRGSISGPGGGLMRQGTVISEISGAFLIP